MIFLFDDDFKGGFVIMTLLHCITIFLFYLIFMVEDASFGVVRQQDGSIVIIVGMDRVQFCGGAILTQKHYITTADCSIPKAYNAHCSNQSCQSQIRGVYTPFQITSYTEPFRFNPLVIM